MARNNGTRGPTTSPGQSTNPSLIGQLGVNLDLSLPNSVARDAILRNAQPMLQQVFSTTVANPTSSTGIVNVKPQNAGLIRGFWVQMTCSINNSDGAKTATLTPFGLANLLSGITYTDFANNQRIQNIPGWYLNAINTVKHHGVFGAALTSDTNTSVQYGANFAPIKGYSTIAPTVTKTDIEMWWYVPVAYSWSDLSGAVYANTINGVQTLQLVINPNAILDAGGDPSLAVYTGSPGSITTATLTVYQDYLDQLPSTARGIILPADDLNMSYLLNVIPQTGVVAATDYPIAYANYRYFKSTMVYVDNGGTLSDGSDINYFALTAANYTNLWKIPPHLSALNTRMAIRDDMPLGSYYFDSRRRPLYTKNFGNLNLNVNFKTVNAGLSMYVGFEQLAQLNQITGAGSLGGN